MVMSNGDVKIRKKLNKTLKQYYREIELLLTFLNCSIEDITINIIKVYLMIMKTEINLENVI